MTEERINSQALSSTSVSARSLPIIMQAILTDTWPCLGDNLTSWDAAVPSSKSRRHKMYIPAPGDPFTRPSWAGLCRHRGVVTVLDYEATLNLLPWDWDEKHICLRGLEAKKILKKSSVHASDIRVQPEMFAPVYTMKTFFFRWNVWPNNILTLLFKYDAF